jgi:hypothetical protein
VAEGSHCLLLWNSSSFVSEKLFSALKWKFLSPQRARLSAKHRRSKKNYWKTRRSRSNRLTRLYSGRWESPSRSFQRSEEAKFIKRKSSCCLHGKGLGRKTFFFNKTFESDFEFRQKTRFQVASTCCRSFFFNLLNISLSLCSSNKSESNKFPTKDDDEDDNREQQEKEEERGSWQNILPETESFPLPNTRTIDIYLQLCSCLCRAKLSRPEELPHQEGGGGGMESQCMLIIKFNNVHSTSYNSPSSE